MASAGVQLSTPLSLGLTLESGPLLLAAGAFACPVAMPGANLIGSASAADVGISWPLSLGLSLGQPASGMGGTLVSGTMSLPIAIAQADVIADMRLLYNLLSQIRSVVAGAVNVNITRVNNTSVIGAGVTGNTWGPGAVMPPNSIVFDDSSNGVALSAGEIMQMIQWTSDITVSLTGTLDANVAKVNGTTIAGSGVAGSDPWRPA